MEELVITLLKRPDSALESSQIRHKDCRRLAAVGTESLTNILAHLFGALKQIDNDTAIQIDIPYT
jgi:hypothetical protein